MRIGALVQDVEVLQVDRLAVARDDAVGLQPHLGAGVGSRPLWVMVNM